MKQMSTTERRAYYNRLSVLGLKNYLAHESERKPAGYADLDMIKRILNRKQRQLNQPVLHVFD